MTTRHVCRFKVCLQYAFHIIHSTYSFRPVLPRYGVTDGERRGLGKNFVLYDRICLRCPDSELSISPRFNLDLITAV